METWVSTDLPPWELSIRFKLSGVVIRIPGGCRSMRRRSVCGVSPLRVNTEISGKSNPFSRNVSPISLSGSMRFCCTSLFSAFSGETYRIRVCPAGQVPEIRPFNAQRKAVRVLPLPVGAVISTFFPAAITGQAFSCTSVGDPKRWTNHRCTSSWKGDNIFPLTATALLYPAMWIKSKKIRLHRLNFR